MQRSREIFIHNEEKNQPTETDPEITDTKISKQGASDLPRQLFKPPQMHKLLQI